MRARLKKMLIDHSCTVRGNEWVDGWTEPLAPPYAGPGYVKLMDRLDGQCMTLDGKDYTTKNWITSSGRIYTHLERADEAPLNYQNLSGRTRRSVSSKGVPLSSTDVSGSQLRIALALRGESLSATHSPWDSLMVSHPALDRLTSEQRRAMTKKFALFHVRDVKKFDYKKSWDLVAEKVDIKHGRPKITGLSHAVRDALLTAYPRLSLPLPSLSVTPDGFRIARESRTREVRIHWRGLNTNNTFHVEVFGPPEPANIIEAIEAYVLRRVIEQLPSDAPLLTCHDEIVSLPEVCALANRAWIDELNRLALEYSRPSSDSKCY